MTELERALAALGEELEFPQSRDVWPRIADRLRRRRWVRPAVFALAAGVAALAIALAVPPAQTRPFATGLGPALTQPTLKLPASVTATKYYKRPGLAAALLRYRGAQLLFAELRGDQMGFAKKFVGPTTHAEEVRIGEWGIWFTGAPHVLMWDSGTARTRLAGNVLIWLQNGVTYRLEGQLNRDRMLVLARQITP